METLKISENIESSLIGTANLGPRFQSIEIGRTCPSLRKAEDAKAVLNCSFLSSEIPVEVNLCEAQKLRQVLMQADLTPFVEVEDGLKR